MANSPAGFFAQPGGGGQGEEAGIPLRLCRVVGFFGLGWLGDKWATVGRGGWFWWRILGRGADEIRNTDF